MPGGYRAVGVQAVAFRRPGSQLPVLAASRRALASEDSTGCGGAHASVPRRIQCRTRPDDRLLALMRRDVVRSQVGEALQLNGSLAAIKTDVGISVAHRDIAMALQITERLAFQIEVVMA